MHPPSRPAHRLGFTPNILGAGALVAVNTESRRTPDLSQKVLTEQLGELVADEVVHREETGAVPAPVIYSLTEYGRTLLPLVKDIRDWGNGHIARFSE